MTDEAPVYTREQILELCDPRVLAALTRWRNGPIPDATRTLGPQWVRWIQRNARLGEGDRFGEAPVMTVEQQAEFWKIAEVTDAGRRRFGLVLISKGKGSGKTPSGAWVGDIDLAGPSVVCTGCAKCDRGWRPDGAPHGVRRRSPDVLVMASSYDQADMILDEMRVTFGEECEDAPLAAFATTMKGLIELKGERGHAKRKPATVKQVDGSKATTLLVDELHEFDTERRENAYDVAAAGTAKRQDGLIVLMSTAGWNLNSLMGRIVSRAKRGEFGPDELAVILEAGEELDARRWDDLRRNGRQAEIDAEIAEGIRQANPLAARGVISVSSLVKQFKDMPLFRALRYFWNRWTPTDAAWLPAGAWDACKGEGEFDPSWPTWLGADMALRRDSAAVVLVQRRPDGRLQTSSRIWQPDGNLIDQAECDDYIRGVVATYNVQWIAADEAWWPTLGTLEAEGLPIFRMPQRGRNMIIAYAMTYRVIVDAVLVHDGAPDYADQIASAAPQSGDGGWTLKKGKNHRRIDSCPALAGAVFASTLAPRETDKPLPRSRVY